MIGRARQRTVRRTRRFLTETENIVLLLWAIGIGLLVSLGLPQVLPDILDRGALCTNLPSPRGGNNRSLLALEGNGQRLGLEVQIINPSEDELVVIGSDETLLVRVTFENKGVGPVTFYYQPDQEVVGPFETLEAQRILGLIFEILPIGTATSLRDITRTGVQERADYALEELYMLPATSKCYVEVMFSAARLQQMGVVPGGEYRLHAYYRNGQIGNYIPPTPEGNRPTPTPMFAEYGLGVWVGTARSNEVRFTIE